jgi:N-ethylmaleimide reductase
LAADSPSARRERPPPISRIPTKAKSRTSRPAPPAIQIHGANGYLVDQFLRNGANFRTDQYGCSIDNRLRFMTEVLEAIGGAIGMERVGIRFSPNIYSQGVEDSDPIALFTAVAHRLEKLNVPWIELREAHQPTSAGAIPTEPVSPAMRPLYSGKILLNSDYDGPSARERMAEGIADAISFGRPFISNPDLVERLALGAPLSPGDVDTFYSGGAAGYVDYPTLDQVKAA